MFKSHHHLNALILVLNFHHQPTAKLIREPTVFNCMTFLQALTMMTPMISLLQLAKLETQDRKSHRHTLNYIPWIALGITSSNL